MRLSLLLADSFSPAFHTVGATHSGLMPHKWARSAIAPKWLPSIKADAPEALGLALTDSMANISHCLIRGSRVVAHGSRLWRGRFRADISSRPLSWATAPFSPKSIANIFMRLICTCVAAIVKCLEIQVVFSATAAAAGKSKWLPKTYIYILFRTLCEL